MRIEMLCTGNELLDGSVVDTNANWFCERAFVRGAPVARKETLPDDLPVLVEAFRQIGARADFLVVSGGMGPTTDDLTVEAAAQAAGVPLDEDAQVLVDLKRRFAERGFTFTLNNARQARVPRGGQALPNPYGTAPAITLKVGKAECFLLPGVPREFRPLCEEQVIPRLEARLAEEGAARVHKASRVLKCFGIGESMLDDKVKALPQRHPHVEFGFRTHLPENHLKLLATGSTAEEARARLEAAARDALAAVGEKVFGADRDELPEVVLRSLQTRGATLALAESCTGGLVASQLASVPGASHTLVFSAVVYQDRAKTQLLGVDPELVLREGAVSAAVTRALAQAAREKAGATFGLAVTGWAGPGGGTQKDPVGTVYVCLSDGALVVEERQRYPFERDRVRQLAAYLALDLLRRHAQGARS
ncbi:MAG: CinA family nicotinamide mononucleotide deamidase-related protein [Deltaproteobacteria bacterium]|nr:CinA family nicotinamide mononucleotide deamidase-related protein [Deltaproteobacteria bacterium]